MIYSSNKIGSKLVLCLLDIVHIGWCIYGLVIVYGKNNSLWKTCSENPDNAAISYMVPIFSIFGFIVIFRLAALIILFVYGPIASKRRSERVI